jgi:hypothetical protein
MVKYYSIDNIEAGKNKRKGDIIRARSIITGRGICQFVVRRINTNTFISEIETNTPLMTDNGTIAIRTQTERFIIPSFFAVFVAKILELSF